jgi:hypothetical protein
METAHKNSQCLLDGAGSYFHGRAAYSLARPLFERALAINEKVLGSEHPNTNRTRRYLACVHLAAGDSAEALTLGEAALAAHEKVVGASHIWTKDSASVTADALDALGRTEEATTLRIRYGIDGGA